MTINLGCTSNADRNSTKYRALNSIFILCALKEILHRGTAGSDVAKA